MEVIEWDGEKNDTNALSFGGLGEVKLPFILFTLT